MRKITCKHRDDETGENRNPDEMMRQLVEDLVEKVIREDKDVDAMDEKELDAEINAVNKEKQEKEEETRRVCSRCCPGIEDLELCMMGLDVTALFPSMSSARTEKIVRRRMMMSTMNPEGFNWKMGLV